MSLMTFLTWMDNLPSSIALRESTWTYPIIESVHSVGICLFVGLTLLWDLRLLGVGLRRIPVSEVWSKLIPWMTLGALTMMVTGVLLFYSKPLFFWSNIFFRLKLVAGTTTTLFNVTGAPVNRNGVWGTATLSLNAFAGQTIRLLFEAADSAGDSLIEAAVDDVRIVQE